MDINVKKTCVERLARVEGQVRGIARMIEDERCCIDIVTQMAAVQAALRKVEEELLKNHVSHCIENAIASGNADEQRQKVSELIEVLGRRRSS
jgi:CsoR family transcriptional regulator, copper-sensing transcriptional repressor